MSHEIRDQRSPWAFIGFVAGILAAAYGAARLVGWNAGLETQVNDPRAAARPVQKRGELGEDEKATIKLFKDASASVVFITTSQVERFSLNQDEIPAGTGSGFVWDDKGHIVTNFHVIQNADRARVTLSDQSAWPAKLVGAAPDFDLAVLKIDAPAKQLPPLPVGKSSDLEVGQKVYAIGNPFGLDHTLTTGIISALGRQIRSVNRQMIEGAIQTDAAINPGNSGGPLLDSFGRLIGVNTQIVSPSGAYAGIGFAIPVDTINQVVPELIRSGSIARPWLGASFAEEALARRWGIDKGVLIINVVEHGPAEKAGLRPTKQLVNGRISLGDVIVSVDGEPVGKPVDFVKLIRKRKVGQTVVLGILRGTDDMSVEIELEPQPNRLVE